MRPLFRWLLLFAILLTLYGAFYKWPQDLARYREQNGKSPWSGLMGQLWTNGDWPQAGTFSLRPISQPAGFPIVVQDAKAAQMMKKPGRKLKAEIEFEFKRARFRPSPTAQWLSFPPDELGQLKQMGGAIQPVIARSKATTVEGQPAVQLWCEPGPGWRSGQWQIAATANISFWPDGSDEEEWNVSQPFTVTFVRPHIFTASLHTYRPGVAYIAKVQQLPPPDSSDFTPVSPRTTGLNAEPKWKEIVKGSPLRAYVNEPIELRALPRKPGPWPVNGDVIYPQWEGRWSNGEKADLWDDTGDTISIYPGRVSRDKNDLLSITAEAGNRIEARFLVVPEPTPTPEPTATPGPPVTYTIEFNSLNFVDAQRINMSGAPDAHLDLRATVYPSRPIDDEENPAPLRLRFRGVDSQGKPFGSMTPLRDSDKPLDFSGGSATVYSSYHAPSLSGKATVWAEVVDANERVLARSKSVKIEFQDVKAWCSYGSWKPTANPDEWQRDIYIFAGPGTNTYTVTPGLKVAAHVIGTAKSKNSWLETSIGTTNSALYPTADPAPLTLVQHARWTPESTFELNSYEVVAEVKK